MADLASPSASTAKSRPASGIPTSTCGGACATCSHGRRRSRGDESPPKLSRTRFGDRRYLEVDPRRHRQPRVRRGALFGSVGAIVRDLVWLQGCDANPPYFSAYPALALGFLSIVLEFIGARHDRVGSLAGWPGVLAILLALAGLVFFRPLCCD